jgi:hypothetical protein
MLLKNVLKKNRIFLRLARKMAADIWCGAGRRNISKNLIDDF